jgi:hypothetical protein
MEAGVRDVHDRTRAQQLTQPWQQRLVVDGDRRRVADEVGQQRFQRVGIRGRRCAHCRAFMRGDG